MARTTKKRAKQLKHDKFRDTTLDAYERLSHRFEGRGRTILYVAGAAVVLVILAVAFSWWRASRADAANLALSKAIEIAEAPVTTATPQPGDTGPTFSNEQERARRAVEEFQKIQHDYGSPYSDIARYFAAANLLTIDRGKGLSELEAVSRSGNDDLAARAKFALAGAREAGGEYDAAAKHYQELLNDKDKSVSENTLKLRLASVYEKQGKKDEAVNLLFGMVEAVRKAQGKDAKPQPESAVVHAAADKLQELSPERFAQLPKEPVAGNSLPF
ncbi:MAG TPA: tetratricopeptide repeat protein [Pyrinomonadaceae bacterium]|nr:tetratricopeptide repeat protein [Pyrinomonadaceae bacterium]